LLPESLLARLRDAHHVCVLTGAGVSAESGVPTFRDAQQGLWAQYDPLELATPDAFQRDPELVWRWYRWRRELVSQAQPNDGHRALAELQDLVPRVTLVTQNVDGLHQRAGSRDVIEFHGNIFANRCFARCDGDRLVDCDEDIALPSCPDCGAPARPGVVWFGEAIPDAALDASFAAAADCDVFLSIGTSSLVYPAAGLGAIAHEADAVTVEVNPDPTQHSDEFTATLRGNAGVILPKLIESLTH
jgi:NAD-dependent deacetylase